jgi:hypothetical protein
MDNNKKSLLRDIALLLIGALISLSTSVLTTILNENRNSEKESIKRKIEFNYKLSKALGNRFYFTYNLLMHKKSTDTTLINKEIEEYLESRQFWNQNIYSYEALLESYYGKDIRNEFIAKVFNPLVDVGQCVERKELCINDTTLIPRVLIIRTDMIRFIQHIYNLTEK